MLYPQNGYRIVATDSVMSPPYVYAVGLTSILD